MGLALARGGEGDSSEAEPLVIFLRDSRRGAGESSRSLSEVALASLDSLEPFLGGRFMGGEATFSPPLLRVLLRSAAWQGLGSGSVVRVREG